MRSLRSINAAFFARSRALRGAPRRGFPHPSGGSPSPSKSPPEGGDPTPKGRGRAAPLSALRAPLRPPGAPLRGSPGFAGSPSRPVWQRRGQAKRAGAAAPERGWKKIKVAAPIAAAGRRQWKCGEGRAAGGQGWGQPVGNPPGCPRGVPASVHGPRSAGRSRSDLHISTARGSFPAPSGGLFCPAGLTTSVQEV